MNLPEAPGRARRLAYGNYIRNRNNNRSNDIFVRGTSYVMRGNVEVNNSIMRRLLISDLFKNSSIYFTKDLFSCSICLNETKDNIIRRLICSHDFHINCIETWLSNNTSCPICRYNLM
jgi:hypothetical protein